MNTTDNDHGLRVWFFQAAGSDYKGESSNTWGGTSHRAIGQDVNLYDTVNNYFQITGVQLEVGDTATPFEHRSYGDELARCQRYAYVIEDNNISSANAMTGLGFWNTTTQARNFLQYPVTMRTIPTFSVDSLSNITQLQVGVDYHAVTAASTVSETNITSMLFITTSTNGTAADVTACRVENGGKVIIDAEL